MVELSLHLTWSFLCCVLAHVTAGVRCAVGIKALGQYQGGIKGRTESSGEFLPDSHARLRPNSVLTGHSQGPAGVVVS